MSDQSAAEEFAKELRGLYEDAGSPRHAVLVRQGKAQRPAVKLSPQTLSDWFAGKSVPADPAAVRFLVGLLQTAAAKKGYERRDLHWWEQLHRRASEERQAGRRGQRPRTRSRSSIDPRMSTLGQVIGELEEADAITLEVHRAITVDRVEMPVLPPYLERAHDHRLREELTRPGDRSRVVILVGGSSTGKTRASWEAIRVTLPGWRVWHPLAEDRPAALVEALHARRVGPRTVIWLNEAQMYLQSAEVGERVATVLQQLLHDRDVAPVLVLGSMWREPWTTLTEPRSTGHAAARELLRQACSITVPDEFTPDDLADQAKKISTDSRLRVAAEHGGRRITQHLAGVPELISRYENGTDAARALIWAAMDARRLSDWLYLPREFLYRAAPGYLDQHVWDRVGEDDTWFDKALQHLAAPCHGADGPLTRRTPRPGDPDLTAGYRLAGYLEQVGRAERASAFPPTSFWDAVAATTSDPALLRDFGAQAQRRGRYNRAAKLYRQAADHGDAYALGRLATLQERAAGVATEALYRQAAEQGDTNAMRALARLEENAGRPAVAAALALKAAELGDPFALAGLADLRVRRGDIVGAEAIAVIMADRGDTSLLIELAGLRQQIGDWPESESLYRQAAERGDTFALQQVVFLRTVFSDWDGAEAIAIHAAERGEISALLHLAGIRDSAGERVEAESLYRRAAQFESADALRALARLRSKAGDVAPAEELYRQLADDGDTDALMSLAELRQKAGDVAGAKDLYRRAAANGDTDALMSLGDLKEQTGELADADSLSQAADRGNNFAVRRLIELREAHGDHASAEAAALRADARQGNTHASTYLVDLREEADEAASARTFALRAADLLGDTSVLRHLAWRRGRAGDLAGAELLYRQADTRGDPLALRLLAIQREESGDTAGAEALYQLVGDRGDSYALGRLAKLREQKGDSVGATTAALQAADRGSTDLLRDLARLRADAGDRGGAEALFWQAIHRGDTLALRSLAQMWEEAGNATHATDLRRFGLTDQGEPASRSDM